MNTMPPAVEPWHMLLTQICDGHTLKHWPQLNGSLVVSTQTPPQSTSGAMQSGPVSATSAALSCDMDPPSVGVASVAVASVGVASPSAPSPPLSLPGTKR